MVLSKAYTLTERGRIANVTSLTVLAVLIVASLAGEALLHSMGTSLASFRIGGGIVLLLIALAMLQAQPDLVRSTPSVAQFDAIIDPDHTLFIPPLNELVRLPHNWTTRDRSINNNIQCLALGAERRPSSCSA